MKPSQEKRNHLLIQLLNLLDWFEYEFERKFMDQSQENETIDVMRAAGILGVEKRRIYDITNALMGANVLQKQGKSHYKWM